MEMPESNREKELREEKSGFEPRRRRERIRRHRPH